jgi:hypothetical protein
MQDHPNIGIKFRLRPDADIQLRAQAAQGGAQALIFLQSPVCKAREEKVRLSVGGEGETICRRRG